MPGPVLVWSPTPKLPWGLPGGPLFVLESLRWPDKSLLLSAGSVQTETISRGCFLKANRISATSLSPVYNKGLKTFIISGGVTCLDFTELQALVSMQVCMHKLSLNEHVPFRGSVSHLECGLRVQGLFLNGLNLS